LTHLYETLPLSPTKDRSCLFLRRLPPNGGGVCGHHYATRHYAPSARRGEKPGGSPDRQGFPASGGHHYPAVPVCDCVELHRQVPYLEWPHTQHPQGSDIGADAIFPNRRWQHSDETDCPRRNWRTHALMAFI